MGAEAIPASPEDATTPLRGRGLAWNHDLRPGPPGPARPAPGDRLVLRLSAAPAPAAADHRRAGAGAQARGARPDRAHRAHHVRVVDRRPGRALPRARGRAAGAALQGPAGPLPR